MPIYRSTLDHGIYQYVILFQNQGFKQSKHLTQIKVKSEPNDINSEVFLNA